MNPRPLRRLLLLVLAALPFVFWFSMQNDRYAVDGDAVSYMDIADLIHAHRWAGVVNAYWHPLYPSLLLAGRLLFHTTRATELGAYYKINFLLLLLQAVAVLTFAAAICRLRDRMPQTARHAVSQNVPSRQGAYLLSVDGVCLLGIALLVVASQRELTLGKVRPDGLLQALLLFGFAAMLAVCAEAASRVSSNLPANAVPNGGAGIASVQHGTAEGHASNDSSSAVQMFPAAGVPAVPSSAARAPRLQVLLCYGALMGLSFGLAYLTKSFAFLVTLLSIAAVAVFQRLWLRRTLLQSALPAAAALLVFALVAGPWVAALSRQKHRLDFGDSGSLNYAWYVAGTEKFHLEPWQTGRFGSSSVHLLHPERQLLASPGIYSYKALPWGTLPPWFDATFFNERIVTHLHAGQLLHRDARNVVLIFRYLLNHPEAWLLLALLSALGATLRGPWRQASWVLPAALGTAIWAIYGIVNVEERYVTAGYLTLLLPVFAALRTSDGRPIRRHRKSNPDPALVAASERSLPGVAAALAALLVLLSLGESVRIAAENRRELSLAHLLPAWRDPGIYNSAQALDKLGVQPGDEIACIGSIACVYDPYWMRLAGVRTTTEVFFDDDHVAEDLEHLPDRDAAYRIVKGEGARVLVGHFDPASFTGPAANGWVRLGSTAFYALPLNLPPSSETSTRP